MPSASGGVATELLATPCLPCRENHLKCDRLIPKCSRCLHSGRECKLVFKFKPAKSSFRDSQVWVKSPRRLTYIDETSSLNLWHSPEESAAYQDESHGSPNFIRDDVSDSSTRQTTHGEGDAHYHEQDSPSHRILFPTSDTTLTERSSVERCSGTSSSSPFSNIGLLSQKGDTQHPTQLPTPARSVESVYQVSIDNIFPHMNETEAQLFRHYVQRLAVCLDVCDPLRNFELVVPQRAATCPTLLKAIFAIAARHLSWTSKYDPLASNRYHDECLGYLIPMLDNSDSVSDENLFAATIILRMLEEMDATSGQDNHSHLLGIHAFVNVGDQIMIPDSLSASSYWVGLRQEIYSAVITQSPVKISLDHFIVDRSFEAADDYTWSNRAVVHLADVLNFCFSDISPSNSQWAYLNEQCIRWDESRPASFEPFYFKERVLPNAFPEIWHHSSCHVVGIQHHILAQLFLTQFDPTLPRVGTKRGAADKRMAQRIDYLLRQLCGMGASNQWTPPALFAASMGIAMFGDRFVEREDQEAMLDVLKKTEINHARPTKSIQHQLMRVWGWISNYEDD